MKYYEMMASPRDVIKSYVDKCSVNDTRFLGKHDNRNPVGFEPIIPEIILNRGKKIPDFFSAGGMLSPRKIVSSRLKVLLENSCDRECIEFFPISLIQNKKKIQGYWITNFVSFSDESLDFEKTMFRVDTRTPIKNKYGVYVDSTSSSEFRKFKDFQEFLEVKEAGWGSGITVFPEKPKVKVSEKSAIILFDKISILGIIVSVEIKKEIEENGYEGIEFRPLETSIEEWYGSDGLRKQFY